ncbi:MAG: BON domain-containing protein [Candidatus Levyibacteriota bacterium]
MNQRLLLAAFAVVTAMSALLAGCAPVIVAGAVGGAALVATDRRSAGAQVDDSSIELKIANNIGAGFGDRVHVNVTSYNGVVLLSGEVPTQDTMNSIVEIARTTPKVRTVHNELLIGQASNLESRTNDSYITAKVKSRFVEANKFSATHVKVVTERQIVYLMGLVTHAEADAASQIAATTTGVTRVVKLFQYID